MVPHSVHFDVDFDFGVDQLMYLAEMCKFPWLLGNVFDTAKGGQPLGNALQTYIVTASNGIKIGLMGLVERSLSWKDC
jgi:5'-nucleotidase